MINYFVLEKLAIEHLVKGGQELESKAYVNGFVEGFLTAQGGDVMTKHDSKNDLKKVLTKKEVKKYGKR